MKCFGIFLMLLGAMVVGAAELGGFCDDWRFIREDVPQAQATAFDDRAWETVTLPHSARLEALPAGKNAPQWQGICWYRKSFVIPASAQNKTVVLRFDGAMNVAEIWVNGQPAGNFMGGYLPYVADISRLVRIGETNVVAVRLDNRDNPLTGPKPLVDLDFNLYSGLYREAHLVIEDSLHITDPVLADQPAGGGVFVTFPRVSKQLATVRIQTNVKNEGTVGREFQVKSSLIDDAGNIVAGGESSGRLASGANTNIEQEFSLRNPSLWSPQSPRLYSLRSEIVENGRTLDEKNTCLGIRRVQITKDGFVINGQKMFLRGVNRHQEYPFIGNALSGDAQYRDALKIKEAGFDYVRCSHYPPSPAFLNACDRLGIVVMDSVLGWQYFNRDPAFAGEKFKECRQLIRRDRNHPSVVLWEVSLNESDMPDSFIARANAIAHEEYPGDQCFTAGWKRGYDVFLQARQHGGCRGITNVPCIVSEYGDWEYYAQNAGFAQEQWKDLKPAERSSRQDRGDGEVRMLQQAENFQEAHNDDLGTTAFADGVWAMFDYNRGYAEDLETSGVMDVFRLPKFSYWFYRSQRDADELVAGKKIGPVLFIANYWTARSPLDVRIYSNCQEVALYLNGRLIERRHPDVSRMTTHLRHPPFTFQVDHFEPGELKAVGWIDGQEVASTEARTPGPAARIVLKFDNGGRPFAVDGKDTVFCRAILEDTNGTIVPGAAKVRFMATGSVKLIGRNPAEIEDGIGTVLVQSDREHPDGAVYATCPITDGDGSRILSAAFSLNGDNVADTKAVVPEKLIPLPTSSTDKAPKAIN